MKYLFLILLSCVVMNVSAQKDSLPSPPYLRMPGWPPLELLLKDSSTRFTQKNLSKKPLLLIVFSPDCSHCQHTAEEIYKSKELLAPFQVVMATLHPHAQMVAFIEKYKLNELSNVVVGQDFYYLLPGFYAIRNLPFMALYTKKGKLISAREGGMAIEKAIDLLKH